MKNVLWISRRQLSKDQFCDLERIYGEVEVRQHSENVWCVSDLRDEIADADVIAAVLPVNSSTVRILSDLLREAGEKPVIRSRMRRTLAPDPDGGEPKTVMNHEAWEQVLRVQVETVDL